MRKLLVILVLIILLTSCTTTEYSVDEYVIDLNWNSAVKDFYMMDTETAADTTEELTSI